MRHNDRMTPQQLEALVLAAIDQLRAVGQIEDDRIEVKREWPGPQKARQLAGAANRARGNDLIYIIGLDEKTGLVHSTAGKDVASWWSQMSARFDQMGPDMVRHINVPTGNGEAVTAVLFATDRAPYMVTIEGGGAAEREVPIRDGTRTRSARRDELLRMLIPEVSSPPVVLLSSSVRGEWDGAIPTVSGRSGRPESTTLIGNADVFVEHVGPDGRLFPFHEMFVELSSGDIRFAARVSLYGSTGEGQAPAFGVQVRGDGVAVTGPGIFSFKFVVSRPADLRDQLNPVKVWDLKILLGVTGSSRPARIDAELHRESGRQQKSGSGYGPRESFGLWAFQKTPSS